MGCLECVCCSGRRPIVWREILLSALINKTVLDHLVVFRSECHGNGPREDAKTRRMWAEEDFYKALTFCDCVHTVSSRVASSSRVRRSCGISVLDLDVALHLALAVEYEYDRTNIAI